MKKFLILLATLFCGAVFADTINLHYLNEDNTVYENSTCTIGNDLILPSTPPTKRGYTFAGWRSVNIRRIEYLESTGTQWIDTDVVILTDYNVSIVYEYQGKPTTEAWLAGAFSGNSARFHAGWYNNTWFIYDGFEYISESAVLYTANGTAQMDTDKSFYLFATNGLNYRLPVKIYSVKIFDSTDTLVRDFIPVLDKEGTPCMFDKVENKIYYNQGTGDFIAGPVVVSVDGE